MARSANVPAWKARTPGPDDLVGVVMRRSERDRLRDMAASRGVTVPALLRTVLGDEQADDHTDVRA
jgi:hypothetical protein